MTEQIKLIFGKCIAIGMTVGILVAALITTGTLTYTLSIGIPLFSQ